MRKIENIYAKNKLQIERKIALLITKKIETLASSVTEILTLVPITHFLTEFNRLLTDLILYIFFFVFQLNSSVFIYLFYFCLFLRKKNLSQKTFFLN